MSGMKRTDGYDNSAIVNNHELGVNIGQLRNVSAQSVGHVSAGHRRVRKSRTN